MVPELSVILPFASVKFPIVELEANVATPAPNVPVVLRSSSPKEIAPELSVILPELNDNVPNIPDEALIVPVPVKSISDKPLDCQ